MMNSFSHCHGEKTSAKRMQLPLLHLLMQLLHRFPADGRKKVCETLALLSSLAFSSVIRTALQRSPSQRFRLQQLAEGLMPVPAHRHRETFSHIIGSYGYILYGRVANPLYIDVHLMAHGQVPMTLQIRRQQSARTVIRQAEVQRVSGTCPSDPLCKSQ